MHEPVSVEVNIDHYREPRFGPNYFFGWEAKDNYQVFAISLRKSPFSQISGTCEMMIF